ncbi:MAG TPA: hypothetical protein VMU55_04125 [Solirubrobacteraceae bacterium]|nr:hypothetical protein [Solirubrobacteraceae bacterium]
MAQTSDTHDDKRALDAFKRGVDGWRAALQAHRLAPPDRDFSARLAGLAAAASEQAKACRTAYKAGYDWTPTRAADSKPPYELQPGSGRRGPDELWQRFDGVVADLSRIATSRDMLAVAGAYEELANAASELAQNIEREDRANGILPRARARRSA